MPEVVFVPEANSERLPEPGDWCFVVADGAVLLAQTGNAEPVHVIPRFADLSIGADDCAAVNFIGSFGDSAVFALSSPALSPAHLAPVALRTAYGILGDRLWAIASRAAQVTEWDSNHRYCGRCASLTVKLRTELGRQCPECGLIAFPRISPATITLIERGDQVLLAHGAHHTTGMYALIAGFVEAGETLEECVSREIREEIGIEVDEIRYFASQSWPFPHSIMLGFNARYRSGEITVNPDEITDARWFSVDELPMIPMRMSIARRLIDDYAARHGRDPDTL